MVKALGLLATVATAAVAQETYMLPLNADPYDTKNRVVDGYNAVASVHVDHEHWGSPENGWIYYPNKAGHYPWVDFFSGFYAEFPERIYDELISDIVKMGYIVTYTFPRQGMKDNDNATMWYNQHKWWRNHASEVVENDVRGRAKITMDNKLNAFGCHSAGCELVKEVTTIDKNLVKAFVFLDPVFKKAGPIDHGYIADEPVELTMDQVVVVQGTALCTRCCTHENLFDVRTYESFSGMKIKVFDMLENQGHCSCLNYGEAEMCRISKFCVMPDTQTRQQVSDVHRCNAGVLVAATVDAFDQTRSDTRKYYNDPANMCEGYVQTGTMICEGEWC